MTTALARCYSTVNGVKKISFEPATNQEFAEVEAPGQKAVAPLAKYLDLQPKNGLTQLFAVKFLMAIGGPSTLGPLKRAFAQDQWEVPELPLSMASMQYRTLKPNPMWRPHSAIGHNSYSEGLTTCGVCINSKTNDRPVIGLL